MSKVLLRLACLVFLIAAPLGAAKWEKVVAPHFTIYSSAPGAETLLRAEELNQFIEALSEVIPVKRSALQPLTVVMFGKEREFRDYRPKRPDGKPWDVAGFFSRRESWAVFGLATADLDEELRRTVFHEAVHWFASAFETPNPPWLEEGLAEVFSTFNVTKGTASWGQAINYHVAVLNTTKPLPVARLLSVTQQDPLFNEDHRTGDFYAGSWVFVHYLLFGQHKMPRDILSQYLKSFRSSEHPDTVFQTTFGSTHAEMDKQLRRYFTAGSYYIGKIKVPPATVPLKLAPVSDVEREVALCRLAIAAGQPARALVHAQAAFKADPANPIASEALGYVADANENEPLLVEAFTEAARLNSKDHFVYFRLGNSIHRDATSKHDLGSSNMDHKTARRVLNFYEKSINLRPNHLPSYQGIGALIGVAEVVGETDEQFLALGRKLFPEDGSIQIGLAILARKRGDTDTAAQLMAGVLDPERKHPRTLTAYAQRVADSWNYTDKTAKIQKLAEADKFAEAIVEIDALLADRSYTPMRNELLANKRGFKAAIAFTAARDAANERKFSEARKILLEIIDSDAPAMSKGSARRFLAELDRAAPARN